VSAAESEPFDATVEATNGEVEHLSRLKGKPAVIFYEDRESVAVNRPFKKMLAERGQQGGGRDRVHVVAVANLSGYDFFPANGIARHYVREAERKAGIPIYIDWEGRLSKGPWSLPPKGATVLLVDAQAKPVWQHSGLMDEAAVQTFFGHLESLTGAVAR